MYRVTEMSLTTGQPTGYIALHDTIDGPIYTAKLTDGRAIVGPTGRVIYPHGPNSDRVWIITKEQE